VKIEAAADAVVLPEIDAAKMLSDPKVMDEYLDNLEKVAKSIDRDISTDKGRKNVASIAYKISNRKSALEKTRLLLGEGFRAKISAINAEGSRGVTRLQVLQDEIRKPLTEYEKSEEGRVEAQEAAIQALAAQAVFPMDGVPVTVADLKERLSALPVLFQRDWEEFGKRATETHESVHGALTRILADREKAEAEAEELATLRAEEEKRQQAWDAMYAAANTENVAFTAAAKAKKDAEDEAERQRVAREGEVQKEKDAAAERERQEKERADKAEASRIAGHQTALNQIVSLTGFENPPTSAEIQARIDILTRKDQRDWQEFLESAVDAREKALASLTDLRRTTVEAEEKAAAEAKRIADDKAAADKEAVEDAAAEKARKKIADDAEAERKAAVAREADTKHRSKINNDVLAVIQPIIETLSVQGKSNEEIAKAIVVWIAKGDVPHITISY
jgi:hypothetical protein